MEFLETGNLPLFFPRHLAEEKPAVDNLSDSLGEGNGNPFPLAPPASPFQNLANPVRVICPLVGRLTFRQMAPSVLEVLYGDTDMGRWGWRVKGL